MNKIYLLAAISLVTTPLIFPMDAKINPEEAPFMAIGADNQAYDSDGDQTYTLAEYPKIIEYHLNNNRPTSAITHTHKCLDLFEKDPNGLDFDGAVINHLLGFKDKIKNQVAGDPKKENRAFQMSIRIDRLSASIQSTTSPIRNNSSASRYSSPAQNITPDPAREENIEEDIDNS